MYFYEAWVTEMLSGSKSLRDAFDWHQPAWCGAPAHSEGGATTAVGAREGWVKGNFNTGQADKETINECLLMLLRRYQFAENIAADISLKLRYNALQAIEDDIRRALELGPRACIIGSDVAIIKLVTRDALKQTIESFPLNEQLQAKMWRRVQSIWVAASDMERACRLAPPAHIMPELKRIDAAATFHPFPSFRLALDTSPFVQGRLERSRKVLITTLNLHRAFFARGPGDRITDYAGFMKAVEATKVLADELRHGAHGLNAKTAAQMTAQLIEHAFTRLLPLPRPWKAKGQPGDLFNPASRDADGEGEGGEEPGFTSVQQVHMLEQLLTLTTHYLAAVCSSALKPTNEYVRELFGKDAARNEEGEQLVVLGALLACFDATLRREPVDKPLTLTELFNGTHSESYGQYFDGNLCFDTRSFLGVSLATLLERITIRRHSAMRARSAVLDYFSSQSEFVRKSDKPNALGERFDVLRESQKVEGTNGEAELSKKQRVTAFQVNPDSQGQAAGDALEQLTMLLVRHLALDSKPIYPPAYLPFNLRTSINPGDERQPVSTFLRLVHGVSRHAAPSPSACPVARRPLAARSLSASLASSAVHRRCTLTPATPTCIAPSGRRVGEVWRAGVQLRARHGLPLQVWTRLDAHDSDAVQRQGLVSRHEVVVGIGCADATALATRLLDEQGARRE